MRNEESKFLVNPFLRSKVNGLSPTKFALFLSNRSLFSRSSQNLFRKSISESRPTVIGFRCRSPRLWKTQNKCVIFTPLSNPFAIITKGGRDSVWDEESRVFIVIMSMRGSLLYSIQCRVNRTSFLVPYHTVRMKRCSIHADIHTHPSEMIIRLMFLATCLSSLRFSHCQKYARMRSLDSTRSLVSLTGEIVRETKRVILEVSTLVRRQRDLLLLLLSFLPVHEMEAWELALCCQKKKKHTKLAIRIYNYVIVSSFRAVSPPLDRCFFELVSSVVSESCRDKRLLYG